MNQVEQKLESTSTYYNTLWLNYVSYCQIKRTTVSLTHEINSGKCETNRFSSENTNIKSMDLLCNYTNVIG